MKKQTRKLQLHRETLRELELAAHQIVGGVSFGCPNQESDFKTCIPK